jgi:WD40 repeat protein
MFEMSGCDVQSVSRSWFLKRSWCCGAVSWAVVSVGLSLFPLTSRAEDLAGKIDPVPVELGRPVSFEDDILPILDSKCIACHNVAISESRLNLEDVPNMLKGGKHGPALIPKDPDKSLLYLVAARAAQPVMPPLPNKVSAEALTPQEVGILRQWILEGAPGAAGTSSQAMPFQSISPRLQSTYALAVSHQAQYAAVSRANQIDLYDVPAGQRLARLTDPLLSEVKVGDRVLYPNGAAHQDFVHALAFHPQRAMLASAGYREVKLWRRSDQIVKQKFAIGAVITAVAVSPNQEWLAVALADHSIKLMKVADGAAGPVLSGHTAPVTALQFSADSVQLFSAGADKLVKQWTIADGQLVKTLETPAPVQVLLLAADGTKVLTGHADNLIRGWAIPFADPKPAEGDQPAVPVAPIVTMTGHGGAITALSWIPQKAGQVMSASQDGTWRIWDANGGGQAAAGNHGAPVTGLSVQADGLQFATAGALLAKLWNINGQEVATVKGSQLAQQSVIELTDDDAVGKSRVALADAAFKAAEKNTQERVDQTNKAKEAKTAAEKTVAEAKPKLDTANAAVEAAKTELAAKPDDEALKKKVADAEAAAAKEVEAVKAAEAGVVAADKAIAQAEKGQQSAEQQQQQVKAVLEAETAASKAAEERVTAARAAQPMSERPIMSVGFAANRPAFFTTGEDGVLRVWSTKAGQPIEEQSVQHAAPVVGLMVAGPRLAVSWEQQQVVVWDADPQWELVQRLGPAAGSAVDLSPSPFVDRVLCLAFNREGTILATGGGDPSRSGEVLLWDATTGSFLKALPDAHSDTVFDLEFSRDGKWLLSCGADKFVKVHDVATGQLVRAFEGHTHHVLSASFKADGSRIASAGADNAIKIWNVETGEQHRTIANYAKQVTSIQFIGVSDNIVSGSGDKTIKMHRANDGGNYRNFGGASEYVYVVACTRDEGLVLSGGADGIVRVWNGQNGQLISTWEPPLPASTTEQAAR